jgi:type VI secretion system protein ImpK
MYRASADALAAAATLGAGGALPAPEALRQQLTGHLRQFVARCRELGVPDIDTAEARYALVAFIDEQVARTNWPGRAEWMSRPLQLELFRETTAGENFFRRMRALAERGIVSPLEVYVLCIALGFVGAPPGGGGAQGARAHLHAAVPRLLEGMHPERIAPNGIPADARRRPRRQIPVAWIAAVAAALLCALTLAGMRWGLDAAIARAEGALAAAPAAPPRSSAQP